MQKRRWEQIESYALNFFQERGYSRMLAREPFESTAAYANGDMVRHTTSPARKRDEDGVMSSEV